MDTPVCPYLGTLDKDLNRGSNVDYPSFENRCLALGDGSSDANEALMLSDQATFCLSQGYHYCPRFQSAEAAGGADIGQLAALADGESRYAATSAGESSLESDWLRNNLSELEEDIVAADQDAAQSRRVWGWMGAGLIFAMVFLCAGGIAIYTGWQVVSRNVTEERLGRVDTLASTARPTDAAVYLVITATSPGDEQQATAATITPTPTFYFPVAVTATPAPGSGGSAGQVPGNVVILADSAGNSTDAAPQATSAPPPQPPTVAPPVIDVQQPVPTPPTRRPTPFFEVPTSTPAPPSPTPVPIPLGPPSVFFTADEKALKADKCTMVRWRVENVNSVYYEGLGVSGSGEKEECIGDDTDHYNLVVFFADGSSRTYTTTVEVILPTPTPTLTATFTPRPRPTATWTPVRPTSSPTPDVTYGVDLGVVGSINQVCTIGETCEIRLVATNTGNQVDDITIRSIESGPWTPQLCRLDGVCANTSIVINDMGPGYTGQIAIQFSIPGDVSRQTATYTFRADSGNANGAIESNTLVVEVEAK